MTETSSGSQQPMVLRGCVCSAGFGFMCSATVHDHERALAAFDPPAASIRVSDVPSPDGGS